MRSCEINFCVISQIRLNMYKWTQRALNRWILMESKPQVWMKFFHLLSTFSFHLICVCVFFGENCMTRVTRAVFFKMYQAEFQDISTILRKSMSPMDSPQKIPDFWCDTCKVPLLPSKGGRWRDLHGVVERPRRGPGGAGPNSEARWVQDGAPVR